jgi:hypothetical protein
MSSGECQGKEVEATQTLLNADELTLRYTFRFKGRNSTFLEAGEYERRPRD